VGCGRLSQAIWRRRAELARFGLAGGINFVLTYFLYLLCLRFVTYSLAYTISYLAGILISYWLSSQFVFQERMRLSKALQFPLIYLTLYLITLGLLYLLIECAHVPRQFAPLLALFFTIPTAYLLSRFVIKGGAGRRQKPPGIS
jgi:putative flippase GtrA